MEKVITKIEKLEDTVRVQAQLLALKPELENGKVFDVEIREHREKRSLDANAYCWVLLGKIAEKLNTDKIAVYREIIKRVGVFDIVCVQESAVERLVKNWSEKGIGWQYDTDTSKISGCVNVILYYGTSTYDTKDMSRFIDEIVEEAKELGIETETPEKIAEMKSLWENAR